ncbi:hypothetical protein QPK87_14930, partial [Kamptonema cortianum]|nr:hypothetical protein [Kamptonema cortianum]
MIESGDHQQAEPAEGVPKGFGRFIGFDDAGTDPFLFLEFEVRAKEILVISPEPVEGIDGGHRLNALNA